MFVISGKEVRGDYSATWQGAYGCILGVLIDVNTRYGMIDAQLMMSLLIENVIVPKVKKISDEDKCPLETPLDFEEGVFDDEVQQNEAIPLSDGEIALDASSEGTMSPGGPRYDYMLSSEAEDDY
ncbi:hypothetical protein Tco_0705383 [Tanacetum coccineum]|uniref:Uncharacterized protein n=1 Tax=Tanacetum coccineum TaxID=301880 RepID=A0ABQ4Y5C2_9ASTR